MTTTNTGVPFSPPRAEETVVDERSWRWNILGRLLRARMANDRETRLTVDIPAQDARSFFVRHLPFTIQCVRGSIWITHPADPGDHTLTAGDSFNASGRGHLVIRAFDPSRVVFARGPAKTTWIPWIQRALARRAGKPSSPARRRAAIERTPRRVSGDR